MGISSTTLCSLSYSSVVYRYVSEYTVNFGKQEGLPTSQRACYRSDSKLITISQLTIDFLVKTLELWFSC